MLGCIRKGDVKDGFSVRNVYREWHWSKLSNSAEVSAAVAMLEEYGCCASRRGFTERQESRGCALRRQTGIRAQICVPLSATASTSSVPLRRDARSRIERRPRWPGNSPFASKPTPSSEILRVTHL